MVEVCAPEDVSQISPDAQERRRASFEGGEDYMSMRVRLSSKFARTPGQGSVEVNRFLTMMRDKGGGNIALAWRRYFDSDGDGELSFIEFCGALAELQYKGDVPSLWIALGGSMTNSLTLEALDPVNAGILDYFSNWCITKHKGPTEVFSHIDADGSDSLTPDEFAEGLRELDFFTSDDLPELIKTEDLVLENLYPLLDQSGHGCITKDQLLFLEQDKEKRVRIERQLARIRQHGIQGAPEQLPKDAERMLHTLAMRTTLLGGKHWKKVKEGIALPRTPLGAGKSPASNRSQQRGMSRTASEPVFRKHTQSFDSPATRLAKTGPIGSGLLTANQMAQSNPALLPHIDASSASPDDNRRTGSGSGSRRQGSKVPSLPALESNP